MEKHPKATCHPCKFSGVSYTVTVIPSPPENQLVFKIGEAAGFLVIGSQLFTNWRPG
jgi:hypothetical protein